MTTKKLSLLRLSARDHAVCRALRFFAIQGRSSQSIAALSRRARLSESTTAFVLGQLYGRGLVRKVRKGKDIAWVLVSNYALARQFEKTKAQLLEGVDPRAPHTMGRKLHVSPTVELELIRGTENIFTIFKAAYAGHKHERVYLTQTAPALVRSLEAYDPERIYELNRIATKHRIILDLIITENVKRQFAQVARQPGWLESQKDMRVDMVVVPEEYLPGIAAEICIFRDNVLFVDREAQSAMLVKSAEIARMQRAMFEAAKAHGESFDVKGFVRAVSERYAERTKSS